MDSLSPFESRQYWSQVATYLASVRQDLERTLPAPVEGVRGLSEDAMKSIADAFDDALFAADAVLGVANRISAAADTARQARQSSRFSA